MMLLWFAARQAAVIRYSIWNTMFEGGDPKKMQGHLDAIKELYGF